MRDDGGLNLEDLDGVKLADERVCCFREAPVDDPVGKACILDQYISRRITTNILTV